MAKVLALGSPKGGVGKSTLAVTIAVIAARAGARVLLVDADENRSALDWTARGARDDPAEHDRRWPLDVADGRDVGELSMLRASRNYDVITVDLPGARAGHFDAMLRGARGRPVADLLLIPSAPEVMDLQPVQRVIRDEVAAAGIAYLLVLTRVITPALPRAQLRRDELREGLADGDGLTVAETIIREYGVYDEARETRRTVLDVPGRHSYARVAEDECRALAAEAFHRLDLDLDVTPEA